MVNSIAEAIAACEWSPAKFLIFSGNVFEPLIYYSHLGVLAITLFFGAFIFFTNRKELINRILFYLTIAISVWLYSDLVLWGSEKMEYIMFFWNVEIIIEPLIYILALYFFYVFLNKEDLDQKTRIISYALLLPTLILAPTNLALTGFDLTNCDRVAVEGLLPKYGYILEIFIVLWIVILAFSRFNKSKDGTEKKKIFFTAMGLCLFLLSFSLGNIAEVITENWYIGQMGYIGIPVFIAFLSYQIVQFKMFNIKLLGSQVFVATIWFLILAILFIRNIENVRIVVALTLALFSVIGILLIRSVKREIKQRQQIESLAQNLRGVNRIMSHDIKNVLGKNKDIFLESLHGTFGPLNESGKKMFELSYNDTTKLLAGIMTILQSGQEVTVNKVEFDVHEALKETLKTVQGDADKKNLKLEFNAEEGDYKIKGDKNLLMVQVFENVIENSIHYTPNGSISITLSKNKNAEKKDVIRLSVKDTGIGISSEDKKKLFTEGGHGKDSLKINVHSTGYGLYIAKKIVDAHSGRIWAESEGSGHGSTFFVELPA